MRYERYILPFVGVVAGGLLWRNRRRAAADIEPGTFVYGYPLELDDELDVEPHSLLELESEMLDEETFPGHHQDG